MTAEATDEQKAANRACRSCGTPLEDIVIDLGMSPLCEDFLSVDRLSQSEVFFPLDVHLCQQCFLVQLPVYASAAEIFADYLYASSVSLSWVSHAQRFVDEACQRLGLGPSSRVVEVASNDGYLLQHVVERGIPAIGVEPARRIAMMAQARGIPTIIEFFSEELANRLAQDGRADLIVANNVFAHVPDLNDFTAGLKALLAPNGVLVIEVAYFVRLMEGVQLDTIYHEHFMYYTLLSAEGVLKRHGLRVFDVETLPTHGGSLRLWVVHATDSRGTDPHVRSLRDKERAGGFDSADGYRDLQPRVNAAKWDLVTALVKAKRSGATIAGYGAPGKGNTLLNFCGIRTDLVDYLVDRNPQKHGRFTPGTRIPIVPVDRLKETRPDLVLLLAWNLRDEILPQLTFIRDWGGRVVIPIPRVEIIKP